MAWAGDCIVTSFSYKNLQHEMMVPKYKLTYYPGSQFLLVVQLSGCSVGLKKSLWIINFVCKLTPVESFSALLQECLTDWLVVTPWTQAQIEFRQDLHTRLAITQRLFLWKRGVEMEFRYLLRFHLQQDADGKLNPGRLPFQIA